RMTNEAHQVMQNSCSWYWNQSTPYTIVNGYTQLANYYANPNMSQPEQAEKLYKRAIEVSEKVGPSDNSISTNTLYQYSNFLRAQGRTKEADEINSRANAIREKMIKSGQLPQAGFG